MRRRDIINELKLCLIGAGLGAAVFGSFLFFGCRAKAASVRDGVHSPVYAVLQTMDRDELADMRAREEYGGLSGRAQESDGTIQYIDAAGDAGADADTRGPEPETSGADGGSQVFSQSDLDLLAALVWAEAGDQDFIGMRIVADCVCNRASDRHPEWPSSISSVIYQPGQFSVVANGRLDQGFYNATPDCYEAARLALSGDLYDPNVIYFSMYTCANGVFAYQHGDHYIGY